MKSPSLCKYILCNLLWHLTPASSQCPYWHWNCWWDAWGQLMRVVSLPRQPTSSRWIGPTPTPKETLLKATVYARIKLYFEFKNHVVTLRGPCTQVTDFMRVQLMCNINLMFFCQPWVEYPSCRHTTVASAFPQKSSHTVPHSLLMQISTLPSLAMIPPTSRSWPGVQGAVK